MNQKHLLAALTEAAEKGDAQAQYNLGVMGDNTRLLKRHLYYSRPESTPGEAVESAGDSPTVKWFRRAAQQGMAKAQYRLGLGYETGSGGKQHQVQAMMWYLIAEANLRGSDRETAVESRIRLARQMEPTEISRAEQLARNWKPRREIAGS